MSKHLKDIQMHNCILVLLSAVRATLANNYASESSCLAGVTLADPPQSVTSLSLRNDGEAVPWNLTL